jgi:hypothetical protein
VSTPACISPADDPPAELLAPEPCAAGDVLLLDAPPPELLHAARTAAAATAMPASAPRLSVRLVMVSNMA